MARALIYLQHREPDLRSAFENHLTSAGYRVRIDSGNYISGATAGDRERFPIPPPDADLMIAERDFGLAYLDRDPSPGPPIILTAAAGTTEDAVDAMRKVATDYLLEPIDGITLLRAVHRALRIERLEERIRRIRSLSDIQSGFSHGMIGESDAIRKVREIIDRVAPGTTPVLILGETGSGKELVAREIHRLSGRKGEFVPINMALLGPNLFEAELFGYEPGSFTGAKGRKQGLLETAEHGTLFLDEIGELDTAVQSRLLRLLDDNRFRRVGGLRELTAQVRFVAATNRKPEALRSDLYYRLAGMEIPVPPLRDRRGDIIAIANHFIDIICNQMHRPKATISESAGAVLMAHSWPGNCRELRHIVERLLLLYPEDTVIEPSALKSIFIDPQSAQNRTEYGFQSTSFQSARKAALMSFERDFFRELIDRTEGNISAAAREAEMDRKYLTKKLSDYGIHPKA